jgi:hypothetical protein
LRSADEHGCEQWKLASFYFSASEPTILSKRGSSAVSPTPAQSHMNERQHHDRLHVVRPLRQVGFDRASSRFERMLRRIDIGMRARDQVLGTSSLETCSGRSKKEHKSIVSVLSDQKLPAEK